MSQTFNYPFNLTSSTASTFPNIFIPTNATIGNVFYNNLTAGSLVTNNLNLGMASMYSGSFNAANNVLTPTAITGLIFDSTNVAYFEVTITIVINITGPTRLNAAFILKGNNNASGWSITPSFVGDNTGIVFSINSSTGQILYTSTSIVNYTSSVFRYSVEQFSANGNYSSILANTFGNYTLGTVQITSTQDAISGVNVGALQVLGGVSISKELLIGSTQGNSFFNTQGQLGINNTVPSFSLDVTGTVRISAGGLISSTINTLGNLYTIGGNVYISGGNFGINTSTPSFLLDVSGGSRFTSITSGSIYSTTGTFINLNITSGSLNIGTLGNLYTITTGNLQIGLSGTKGTLLLQNNINTTGNMLNANTVGNSITTDVKVMNNRLRTSRANANTAVSTWNSRPINNVSQSIIWCSDLGLFISGVFNGGTNSIQTSVDGINWVTRTTPNITTITNICWSAELNLLVATSHQTGSTSVITSSNGITWALGTTPNIASGLGWTGVCWSPELSLFVSVNLNATANTSWVMTSSNGTTTWVQQTGLPSSNNWWSICWSSELGLFCAVNSNTSTTTPIATSSDGITWTMRTTPSVSSFIGICWSPELYLFVAVGQNTTSSVLTSPDGINWSLRTTPNSTWFNVIWSSELSIFVATSNTASTTSIMTSSNGINWTSRTTPSVQIWGICWSPEESVFVGVNPTITTYIITNPILPNSKNTVLLNQLSVNTTSGSLILQNRITSTGSMISNSNTIGSLITTDLKVMNKRLRTGRGNALNAVSTWSTRTAAASKNWNSICWSPELSLFVAVAIDTGTNCVMSSSDGINWTIGVSGSTAQWLDVCWSSELGLFVAISNHSTLNTAWIMTSSNGTTWTQLSGLASANNWGGVCWSPELGIFVATSWSGYVSTSSNGTTWSSLTTISGMLAIRVKWSSELGMFVCTNYNNSTSGFMYSYNGTTWNTVSFTGTGYNWSYIAWSPELYLWVASPGLSTQNIATSPDGINWTLRNTGLSATAHGNVVWSSELSLFVIAGATTTNINWSSHDGINWVARNTNPGQVLGLCWSPELSIFCGVVYGTSSVVTSNFGLPTIKNVAYYGALSYNLSSNQTLTNNTNTIISWSGVVSGSSSTTGITYSAGTFTNSSGVPIIVQISVSILFDISSVGVRYGNITSSDLGDLCFVVAPATSTDYASVCLSNTFQVSPLGTFSIKARHTKGSNMDILGGGNGSCVSVLRIR